MICLDIKTWQGYRETPGNTETSFSHNKDQFCLLNRFYGSATCDPCLNSGIAPPRGGVVVQFNVYRPTVHCRQKSKHTGPSRPFNATCNWTRYEDSNQIIITGGNVIMFNRFIRDIVVGVVVVVHSSRTCRRNVSTMCLTCLPADASVNIARG